MLNALLRKEACFQCSNFEEDIYEEARTLRYQRCSVVHRHDWLRQFTGRRQAKAFRSGCYSEPLSSICSWALKLRKTKSLSFSLKKSEAMCLGDAFCRPDHFGLGIFLERNDSLCVNAKALRKTQRLGV